MVNAGESTGTLPDVLLRLAGYAKKKEEVESKVRSAMTYPVIMLVVGMGVVVFLLSYLVPKITPILTKKNEALPKGNRNPSHCIRYRPKLLVGISYGIFLP